MWSWTLKRTKARSRAGRWSWAQENPGEIKSKEVELKSQKNPGEIKSREVELESQSPGEIKRKEEELDSPENLGEMRSRAGRWSWAVIAGWFVLLQSCSSTVASRTLSL